MTQEDKQHRDFQAQMERIKEHQKFFRTVGEVQYDAVIECSEETLSLATTLWSEGNSHVVHRLKWYADTLDALKRTLTKDRSVRELGEIVKHSRGHLHNEAAEGRLPVISQAGERRTSLLTYREHYWRTRSN